MDDFTSNPWQNPNNQGVFSSNNYPGEGMLVYPGSAVGLNQVVPSMRLKWLRDGVEDYEYLQILRRSNPGAGYADRAIGRCEIFFHRISGLERSGMPPGSRAATGRQCDPAGRGRYGVRKSLARAVSGSNSGSGPRSGSPPPPASASSL